MGLRREEKMELGGTQRTKKNIKAQIKDTYLAAYKRWKRRRCKQACHLCSRACSSSPSSQFLVLFRSTKGLFWFPPSKGLVRSTKVSSSLVGQGILIRFQTQEFDREGSDIVFVFFICVVHRVLYLHKRRESDCDTVPFPISLTPWARK